MSSYIKGITLKSAIYLAISLSGIFVLIAGGNSSFFSSSTFTTFSSGGVGCYGLFVDLVAGFLVAVFELSDLAAVFELSDFTTGLDAGLVLFMIN